MEYTSTEGIMQGQMTQQPINELARLFLTLKGASSNQQVKQVEQRLYQLERFQGFVSNLLELICSNTAQPDVRVAGASHLRRIIARCRTAPIESKLNICSVVLLLLRSDASIKLKKIALAGSTLLMNVGEDGDRQVQQYLCKQLSEELLKDSQQPELLNPRMLEYVALLGQMVLLSEEVPLEFVTQTFNHFVLMLIKVADYTAPMLQQSQEVQHQNNHWYRPNLFSLALLKELTVVMRIIFKRKDFIASEFFKQLLVSRDIVMLLERIYVMSTNQSEIKNSLLEVSELQVCTLLNDAKSNCIFVQGQMLRELVRLDARVFIPNMQDNVQTAAYLYDRSAAHLSLFLASMLNCKWLEHKHSKKYASVRRVIEEILRFATQAVSVPVCYEHFSQNRESWLMDFLMKSFESCQAELDEFEEDPQNYLCYVDQLMKDEPDPDQLASDNQDDLVVHIAARSLLRALFRHVDGACTYFCRWCFDILITASANDPVRLVALKLLGVIRESLVDRPEFVRQLVAYYQLRNFGRPTHIVQKIEECLHIMVLSKYLRILQNMSPTIKAIAIEFVSGILTDKLGIGTNNSPAKIAALWLIAEVFKESTEHCVEALTFLLGDLTPENASNERIDAIFHVVCDSSTIHSQAQLLKHCVAKMVEIVGWQLKNSSGVVLVEKAWDVVVEICCSKLLLPSSIPMLQLQLLPMLAYIKEPVRVDLGDEFVQIVLNFVSKSNQLSQFTMGAVALFMRIFEENGCELDEMLHLANSYLLLGGVQFHSQNPGPLVIFSQMALHGLSSKVALYGRIEAAILLQTLPQHAATLWRLGQMPVIINHLHTLFREEASKINGTLAEQYTVIQHSLVAALTLIISASVNYLPELQKNHIIGFCITGQEYIKDIYALKCYCCGLLTLLKAHLSKEVNHPSLDELLELVISKLHSGYTKLHLNVWQKSKKERTQRFTKMMERLHNVITESDEFTEFKSVMDDFRRNLPQLYIETTSSLSIAGKEKLRILYGVQTMEVGVRQIVRIKRT